MALVLFLSLLILAMTLPDAARKWFPLGSLNDAYAKITARGGTVDLPGTPYQDRIRAVVGFVAHPGDEIHVAVASPDHRKRTLETIAGEDLHTGDTLYYTLITLREIVALIFVLLGSALVLLRPGILTWMLYLFCLRVAASAPALAFQAYLPTIGADLEEAFYDVIPAVGYISAMVFAARFSNPRANDWREWCVRSAPWLLGALGALGIFSEYGRTWFSWETATGVTTFVLNACDFAICCVAVAALLARGRNGEEPGTASATTAPPKWLIASAFAVALAGFLSDDLFGNSATYLLHSSLLMLSGVIFIAIVYSILRYDFLDVHITAAVSAAILSSTALLMFVQFSRSYDSLLDEKFKQLGVPAALSLAVTIAAGALLHRLFSGGEKMVESLAYHRRIEARKRLRQVTLDVADASSIDELTHLLCERVVEVFGLTSAAFFQVGEKREFRRASPAVGWGDLATTIFEPTDAVVRDLVSGSRLHPIRLSVPPGYLETVSGLRTNMTLPIWIRGQLAAFVIYGALRNGEKWESDDVEAIGGLELACTAALYHLEADRRSHRY